MYREQGKKILTPIQLLNCMTAAFVAQYMGNTGDCESPAMEEMLITVPPLPPSSIRISSNAFKVLVTTAV